MIWFFIVVFIAVGLYLLYLQYSTRKYFPGNAWKLENGNIAIIVDILEPSDEFFLVVEVNNQKRFYNLKGERVVGYNGTKFKKHLGTKKQVPEYFL